MELSRSDKLAIGNLALVIFNLVLFVINLINKVY
jgi:hypothetical protein